MVKLSPFGTQQWASTLETLEGSIAVHAWAIAVDEAGNSYVGGDNGAHGWSASFDSDGSLRWVQEQTLAPTHDVAYDAAAPNALLSIAWDSSSASNDWSVHTHDPSGTAVTRFPFTANFHRMAVDPQDDSIYVVGESRIGNSWIEGDGQTPLVLKLPTVRPRLVFEAVDQGFCVKAAGALVDAKAPTQRTNCDTGEKLVAVSERYDPQG